MKYTCSGLTILKPTTYLNNSSSFSLTYVTTTPQLLPSLGVILKSWNFHCNWAALSLIASPSSLQRFQLCYLEPNLSFSP